MEQLRAWLHAREDEHLEFKEAKGSFDFETLVKYCAALANESGGHMVLGVSDKRPRRVVGTAAFANLERTKAGLIERLRLRIEAEEVQHPGGRVVVFSVPARPLGVPIAFGGAYWMRAGEDLVPMTQDQLRRIFAETVPDFSAEVCPSATAADLDPEAVARFRAMWRRKSGNAALDSLTDTQLLADAELLLDDRVTYAALVLLGTRRALSRHLGQAEVIFEYRSSDVSGPAQQRLEYRMGCLLFLDELWNTINLRNDLQHFQDGLYIWNVPTFNEAAVREAVLNAVSHRDYRLPGSVFVRQFPRRIEIVSPGGFVPGITPENFLWRQAPRNRRLAEAFARCGLVERAGQGVNRMFEECIREGKRRPDLTGTDDYEVHLTLHGDVQDPRFLRFLEKVGQERSSHFSTEDLLVLDLIHRQRPVGDDLRPRLLALFDEGIVERLGRGRDTQYLLARKLYGFLGQAGAYTRRRGLDRETNKALLLRHIEESGSAGAPMHELLQVLPALSRKQVRSLTASLRLDGRVRQEGRTSASRWYAQGKDEEPHSPEVAKGQEGPSWTKKGQ